MKTNQVTFESDSSEYELIANAALSIKDVDGLVIEIGTRLGAGIFTAMKNCIENNDKNRFFIGVDPYGSIDYKHGENSQPAKDGHQIQSDCGFDVDMMNKFLANMYIFCYDTKSYYSHYALEDSEFMRIFEDGVIVYKDCKKIINNYALVIIDGPHDVDSVKTETLFFKDRMSIGGIIVYDDIRDYDHDSIHNILIEENFSLKQRGNNKATYIKNDCS